MSQIQSKEKFYRSTSMNFFLVVCAFAGEEQFPCLCHLSPYAEKRVACPKCYAKGTLETLGEKGIRHFLTLIETAERLRNADRN
jgi:hypothetical protein